MNPVFTPDRKFFFCECGAKVSVDAKSCPSCGDTKAKAKAENREKEESDSKRREAEAVKAKKAKVRRFALHWIWISVVLMFLVAVSGIENSSLLGVPLMLSLGMAIVIAVIPRSAYVLVWTFLILTATIVGASIVPSLYSETPGEKAERQREEAKERAREARKEVACLYESFSGISISNSVERGIEERLNDPDSFDFIRARRLKSQVEGFREYEIIFRAKNSFGGVVQGKAVVTVDNKCNPLSVIME